MAEGGPSVLSMEKETQEIPIPTTQEGGKSTTTPSPTPHLQPRLPGSHSGARRVKDAAGRLGNGTPRADVTALAQGNLPPPSSAPGLARQVPRAAKRGARGIPALGEFLPAWGPCTRGALGNPGAGQVPAGAGPSGPKSATINRTSRMQCSPLGGRSRGPSILLREGPQDQASQPLNPSPPRFQIPLLISSAPKTHESTPIRSCSASSLKH
ncbi:hematopoietic cell signal transducer isoform X1 [Mesocricetus auratus]|uniref:Hematopoietic cell signal transducer isoform X1 n=1 Tax=Mesocricetus auratus TaxID=10036 RepID=A0ABM2WRL2_MESAU|nr:hematopoietic cell signal transducer isoform X1 [Mesocricetus auratus]XP_040591413.1 hematopoietic cell signal transducer isoform X1 [Mesocricetus auratus]